MNAKGLPKVLLLLCGGTLVMSKNESGALDVPPSGEGAIGRLIGSEPRLQEVAQLKTQHITNIDSTNMHPRHWDEIATALAGAYQEYDGFVITHGTDSLAYTAAALSFALQGLGKPVALTGAQIPGARVESDARRNLVNAVRLAATQDASGVFVVFDERIILGSRASKVSESALDGFRSVNVPDAGDIRIQMQLAPHVPARHGGAPQLHTGFEPDIAVLTLTPGCDATDLEHLLSRDRLRGVVIRGFGPGNIPQAFLPALRLAQEQEVPVVSLSQCVHGKTAMHAYEVGRKALEMGVIEGKDMCLEAACVKLMWALPRTRFADLPAVMHRPIAGEIRG